MSLVFCIFKFITKLLKSAKTPFRLTTSGKFPLYLPNKTNVESDKRSGICKGYTYINIANNAITELQDQGKRDKNATHTTKNVNSNMISSYMKESSDFSKFLKKV